MKVTEVTRADKIHCINVMKAISEVAKYQDMTMHEVLMLGEAYKWMNRVVEQVNAAKLIEEPNKLVALKTENSPQENPLPKIEQTETIRDKQTDILPKITKLKKRDKE